MTDEQTTQQPNEQAGPSSRQEKTPGDPWQEVGRQFQALGNSLAAAFGATWQSEETQKNLHKMQAEFQAAAEQISDTVKKAGQSEEAQRMQAEVEKAAREAQKKGQEAYSQVQPELVSAFRTIRAEVDKLIDQMEQNMEQPAAGEESTDSASDAEAPNEKTE